MRSDERPALLFCVKGAERDACRIVFPTSFTSEHTENNVLYNTQE